jgi:hypothetical protein
MTSPAPLNGSQIDHASSVAICEEIGDRLRLILGREPHRLSDDMIELVEQMAADQPAMSRPNRKTEVAQ